MTLKPFSHAAASAILVSSALVASAEPRTYLNIGDPAPALRPAKWIKGMPVPAFKPGQVYVVEFWATWCTPCKANIPHLTELAKRFPGKVSVIGVDVWESNDPTIDTLPKVVSFVKSEGPKMDYVVAADALDNRIADAWMKKAGEGGLPTSFIVGKDGKIAWTGYPASLDKALAEITEDRFDLAAARAQRAVEVEVTRPIAEAEEAKEWRKLLALTDAAAITRPETVHRYAYDRLVALFHVDVPAAKAKATEVLAESNGEIGIYQMLASIFASQKDLAPDTYRYGSNLIDEALEKEDRKYLFLAMKAEVEASLGDLNGAVKHQQAAVEAADVDVHATPEFRLFLRKNLEKFAARSKTPS